MTIISNGDMIPHQKSAMVLQPFEYPGALTTEPKFWIASSI